MSAWVPAARLAHALFGSEAGYLEAKIALLSLYAEVDAKVAETTKDLTLPCHAGCDACCHEAVFLTPLEFVVAYDYLSAHTGPAELASIVREATALYEHHQGLIDAFDVPPPGGAADHTDIARQLKFRCPLLAADGGCRIYPVRELYARLFGASFNAQGGIYGCHLVGEALVGQTLTLLNAASTAQRLSSFAHARKRQVFPHYFAHLWLPE